MTWASDMDALGLGLRCTASGREGRCELRAGHVGMHHAGFGLNAYQWPGTTAGPYVGQHGTLPELTCPPRAITTWELYGLIAKSPRDPDLLAALRARIRYRALQKLDAIDTRQPWARWWDSYSKLFDIITEMNRLDDKAGIYRDVGVAT